MATHSHVLLGNETYNGVPFPPNDDFVVTDNGVGSNTVTLGNGTDQLTLGSGGNNTMTLGDGADQIIAGGASNTITTGNGNSHITVANGSNTITVGNGGSTIALGTGGTGDTVHTGSGNNIVSVSAAAISGDTIMGALTSGDGTTNRLVLTTAGTMNPVNVSGFQSYRLADGGANILTLAETNFVRLPGGSITVQGGNSGNTVDASALSAAHSVVINAGAGTDVLTGGAGNDLFIFSAGNLSADIVNGGAGMNTLELTAGAGTLTGLGSANFNNLGVINVDASASWLFSSTQNVTDTINLAAGSVGEFAGAVGSGHTIAFNSSSGTLKIDSAAQFAGKIIGFQTGDLIDLTGEGFDSNGSVILGAGNVLQVTQNGHTDNLTIDPNKNLSGVQFHISSDGTGGTDVSLTSAPPNSAAPIGTTADMILRHTDGTYEIYNMGNDSILAANYLGQVGSDYQFAGLGNFSGSGATGMMLRSATSSNFEIYDISNNNITGAAALGAVGSNFQVAGFGNFNGSNTTTDMMLRDSNTGAFELYDINHDAITGASAIGAVGLDWQVQGFGDFNGDGTTDMMLRNTTTGTFEDYDIKNGQIVGAHGLGAVGNDWQLAGFGDFDGNGTTDMMLRNTTTGIFELYGINNDVITSASPIGAVGLDWQVAGFGPIHGVGSADMVLRNVNSGAFEVYNIAGSQLTGAASLGAVGLDWQVGGFAVHLPTSS